MRTVYIAILIAAMLPLAVGGWIVEGGRKILSPRPRLTPHALRLVGSSASRIRCVRRTASVSAPRSMCPFW